MVADQAVLKDPPATPFDACDKRPGRITSQALVHGAVRDALRLGAISYDAVKHLALCRIENRPARLDLARYPHLALTAVATTSASSYMSLLSGETP